MNIGILFKCSEAAHVCDKSQYHESSVFERVLMKLHQMMCRVCREHSSENTKLTKVIEKADLKTMPEDKKEDIRKIIQQEISK